MATLRTLIILICTIGQIILCSTQASAATLAVVPGGIYSPKCFGSCNGALKVTGVGGVAPYTYAWSNGETRDSVGNLCAGTYSVTVHDFTNATATISINLNQPSQLVALGTYTNNGGNCTDTLFPTVTGGAPPYILQWTRHGVNTGGNWLPNICANERDSLRATDANGCTVIWVGQQTSSTQLTLTPKGHNILCFGACNGSAKILANGGTAPYTYRWSNGASSDSISHLCPGSYTVSVFDATNTYLTSVFNITQPQAPLAAVPSHTSLGGCQDSAWVTVSGGTWPFGYHWLNSGSTTSVRPNLCPGDSDVVIVNDGNGCTVTQTVSIPAASAPGCYNFDDVVVPYLNKEHAFNIYGNGNGGFLNNWRVTSGTPSIYQSGSIAGVNAYDGNQYALMGVCDAGGSEGVSLGYNFLQGHTYNVSLAVRNIPLTTGGTPTPLDVHFVLLQNAINYTYNSGTGCSPTPSIPANSMVVDTLSNFSQNTWQVIHFTVSNLQSDFSQLWIRSEFSAGAPFVTTIFAFDSVCVQEVIAPPSTSKCISFDDAVVPVSGKEHSFDLYGNGHAGFLSDWHVTSGTPSVYQNGFIAGVNAYDGNQYALLGICDGGGNEGASLAYNFQQGQSYTVSMAVRNIPLFSNTPTPIDMDYILMNDTITYAYNYNTGCSAIPAIPSNSFVAHSMDSFDLNAWQVVTFNIINLQANYSQLWFRGHFSNGAPFVTTIFAFDSLCIKPYTPPTPTAQCYNFDDTTVPSANQQHAFNIYGNGHAGFLHDWHVTSGTPNIYKSGDVAGVNAYDGNQYAMMGVCDVAQGWSEGLSLGYNFTQGHSYKVSMAVRNVPYLSNAPTPIDVKFVLLHDTINYPYQYQTGCSTTPSIPAGSVTVDSIMNYNQNAWSVISFNINNLTSDFSQLWIRSAFSSGSPLTTTFFCIDSMCIQPLTGDVWPGDADNSGLANNYDILTLGQGYLDQGTTRPNASLVWTGQPSNDWTTTIPNGNNEKYADCNGDGTINADDTLAVSQNYGLTHQKSSPISNSNDPRLYINLPANYTVQAGQTIQVPIYLGTSTKSVAAVYGVAFSLEYDNTLVKRNSEDLASAGSWMGTRGINLLTFNKDLYDLGRTDVTLTCIDKLNKSGYGLIGTLSYTMKDDISGKDDIIKALGMSISRVKAIKADGTEIALSFGGLDTVTVVQTGIEDVAVTHINLYPNPANQYIMADAGNTHIDHYLITDVVGRNLASINGNSGATRIDVSSLSNGIYFLHAYTGKDVTVIRFSVHK